MATQQLKMIFREMERQQRDSDRYGEHRTKSEAKQSKTKQTRGKARHAYLIIGPHHVPSCTITYKPLLYFLFSTLTTTGFCKAGLTGDVYQVQYLVHPFPFLSLLALFFVCVLLLCLLHSPAQGGSYGNEILYKNLDLTQDFPNKISFHFLWVKMLPKNLPKIFRWPEMCPLDKILAQDFQMAAFTKILGRRDTSVVPLLSTENCKTLF